MKGTTVNRVTNFEAIRILANAAVEIEALALRDDVFSWAAAKAFRPVIDDGSQQLALALKMLADELTVGRVGLIVTGEPE